MKDLSSLEKKAELQLAKRIKPRTHFTLKVRVVNEFSQKFLWAFDHCENFREILLTGLPQDVLSLMAHHRRHTAKLDEMEKVDFITLINNHFKFDDKVILERIFQAFDTNKVN